MIAAARRAIPIAVLPFALGGLALSACSTPYGSSSASPVAPTTTAIVGFATPAKTLGSTLRSQYTGLLVEQAYLLGATTAPVGGPPDAAGQLAGNIAGLATLMGEGYGPAFAAQIGPLWSARINDLVAYGKAGVAKNIIAQSTARTTLASDETALATFLHNSNQYLAVHTVTNPATGIGDEFIADDTLFMTFMDAQATGDPTTYAKLVAAAEAQPHTAEVLAAAEGKLYPAQYPGTISGAAADLRSSVLSLMVQHVELVAIADGIVAQGADPGPAATALAANSDELHNAISSMSTDVTATQFTTLWTAETAAYAAYATAAAHKDSGGQAAATSTLGTFEQQFGQFIAGMTQTKVSASAATAAITAQNAAVTAVIDAAATGAANEATLTRAAVNTVPGWIGDFTEAIAEIQNARYLP